MLVGAVVGTLVPTMRAEAAPVCSTPSEFHDSVAQDGIYAESGTLTFTITGLPYEGIDKQHLVYINDKRELEPGGLGCVGLDFKSWGSAAAVADAGTVKLELFDLCCVGADCSETWAGPRPSDVVFTSPDQVCDVEVSFTPQTFGYAVACTPGVSFGFDDPNKYAVAATEVLIPIADVATVSDATFCYEAAVVTDPEPDPGMPMQVKVLEDVTASPLDPTTVYGDPTDLVVSVGDGEIFLKFSLEALDGEVTSATLFIHSSTVESAEGDGGDLYVVGNDWAETTLTWSDRPATQGTVVGRVGPAGIAPGMWYSVDVSAAVSAPDVYSFAIVPSPADTNGAHFESKEASLANAPYLEVTVEPTAGTTTGDDGDGTATDGTAGGGTDTEATTTIASGPLGGTIGLGETDTGCTCRAPDQGATPGWLWIACVAWFRRRRASVA